MSCSRTQHGDACEDRTQELSIWSLTLYHYATALTRTLFKDSYINIYVQETDIRLSDSASYGSQLSSGKPG